PCVTLSFSTRPPTATAFPYTTLFRSGGDVRSRPGQRLLVDPRPAGRVFRGGSLDDLHSPLEFVEAVDGAAAGETFPAVVPHAAEDRKSTRLNSSHEWISYAVFCLKKK